MTLDGYAIDVRYEDVESSAVPIVLFHEGLGSAAMWRDFPAKLAHATKRQVISWSRQGYGQSGQFAGPYDCDFMHREADAADRTMNALGIARAHVFGHSDGASIALLLAARHPERVDTLLLEAPHVMVEQVCLEAIESLRDPVRTAELVGKLGRYHRDAAKVFSQWFAIWTDPAFAAWNIEQDIDETVCPTLLIQGAQDEYGTFEQLERIARLLPQARQLRLEDCRHSPHRDQEDAVLAATAAFLEEVGNG